MTIIILSSLISLPATDVIAECQIDAQYAAMTVMTHLEYYSRDDDIIITGSVRHDIISNNVIVLIQIYAPNGELLKSENATLNISDGTFTHKVRLDNSSDLEEDRQYKVTAVYGSHEANWSFLLTSGIVDFVGVDIGVPIVRGVDGNIVVDNEVEVGQQVVLSTIITNSHRLRHQPYAAITEVKDSTGITVHLAIQSSVLKPDCSTEFGFSWAAEKEGQYEARTFVITSLAYPQVLSMVTVTEITAKA